jgi:hypothetical protein
MIDRYGPRDSAARIEALIQAALASDYGKRKIAAAHDALNLQLHSGRLTAESVLDVFKRQVDIAVANHLSRGSEIQVGYHNYACSGLASKAARRLADDFLARVERPLRS